MPVNPSRGEVEIELGDRTFTLRPSFTVLREIESQLGSIFEIGKKMQQGAIGISEMTMMIFCAVRKEHKDLRIDDVGRMVVDQGPVHLIAPLTQFIINAVDPGKAEVVHAQSGEERTLN